MSKTQKRDRHAGLINLIVEAVENEDLHGYSQYEDGTTKGCVSIVSYGDLIAIDVSISFINNDRVYSLYPVMLYTKPDKDRVIFVNEHISKGWYEVTKRVLLNHIEK